MNYLDFQLSFYTPLKLLNDVKMIYYKDNPIFRKMILNILRKNNLKLEDLCEPKWLNYLSTELRNQLNIMLNENNHE